MATDTINIYANIQRKCCKVHSFNSYWSVSYGNITSEILSSIWFDMKNKKNKIWDRKKLNKSLMKISDYVPHSNEAVR